MDGMRLLLLHMVERVSGERSLAGCYNILIGKKSTQAIQDAALFGFRSWFGLFGEWKRSSFDQLVTELLLNGELLLYEEQNYVLSAQAEACLHKELERYHFFRRAYLLQASKLHIEEIFSFWNKLQLLGQVLSHYLAGNKHYSPIVTDFPTQEWLKQIWQSLPSKEEFAQQFKEEIREYLERLEDEELANLLLDRFSGYQVHGKTFTQVAERCNIPVAFVRLYFFQGIGYLQTQVKANDNSVLRVLLEHKDASSSSLISLTSSAQKTYHLLDQAYTLEEIARLRQLKQSTIEDHVLEIAISLPSFDCSAFISEAEIRKIIQLSQAEQTKKLRLLKEKVGQKFSYFQLRLALIKGRHEGEI